MITTDEYRVDLLKDLVTQFQDQPKLKALLTVIQKQFEDVITFLANLKVKRWLGNAADINLAMGEQLDRIGDIVCLSRGEAGYLACLDHPDIDVLSDEEYRRYLIFKIWKNTNNCTYHDVIKVFKMFWEKPLLYSEDPSKPATMLFETEIMKPFEMDVEELFKIPIVRAAGVGIYITAITQADEETAQLYTLSHLGRGLAVTPVPEWLPKWPGDISLYVTGMMPRWYKTVINTDLTETCLVVRAVPEQQMIEIWGYLKMLGSHDLLVEGSEEGNVIYIQNAGISVEEDSRNKTLIITGG